MKTLLVGLLVAGALVLGFMPSGVGANAGFAPAGVVLHPPGASALRTARVAKTTTSYTCGAITCSAFETGINGFFQDVAAASGATDNVYSVNNQYSDNTGAIAYNETFGGTYVDTSSFPASGCPNGAASECLTEAQLVTEMGNVLTTKGWTANGTNLFVILLPAGVDTCFDSADCASNVFCAYHDSSGSLLFAVEPFQTYWGCDGTSAGEGLPNGAEIDESVNTLSHEHNEAITDPNQANYAWYSSSGDEIGDLCAWSYGTPLGTTLGGQPYNQVINGHDYSMQLEYSNAANSNTGGCVSHLGGAATGITDGGSGPLTYHGGPVMRTNTVYTIYWIPAPVPAISISPVVTGADGVGQQLSTTDGTWTNSPTSFQYKWQRCSSAGINCVDIASATAPQYTLVAADVGHKIRSEVLASNGAGPAPNGYAVSALTNVVVAKPSIVTLPKVSGIAKVGNSLSVGNGTWKYSPTSYAYQWLRCTALGYSCKTILGATTATHLLTSADAGHKLEAKVTATNAAGSGTATSSNKSAKITP